MTTCRRKRFAISSRKSQWMSWSRAINSPMPCALVMRSRNLSSGIHSFRRLSSLNRARQTTTWNDDQPGAIEFSSRTCQKHTKKWQSILNNSRTSVISPIRLAIISRSRASFSWRWKQFFSLTCFAIFFAASRSALETLIRFCNHVSIYIEIFPPFSNIKSKKLNI